MNKSELMLSLAAIMVLRFCELVSINLLSNVSEFLMEENIGLHRDDRLMLHGKSNGRKIDIIRKEVMKVFEELGFNIQTES